MASSKVTRCICHNRSFQDIREYAREQEYTCLEELRRDRYCSCGCGICAPYVEMVLKTGETEFEPGAFLRHRGNRQ